ncbi:hypothetical protein BDZ97DRAFT_572755 [Flammula alnicola]|nr:hypothetical protein BDZ97DRAFT_572755 [Flammula alnicola]
MLDIWSISVYRNASWIMFYARYGSYMIAAHLLLTCHLFCFVLQIHGRLYCGLLPWPSDESQISFRSRTVHRRTTASPPFLTTFNHTWILHRYAFYICCCSFECGIHAGVLVRYGNAESAMNTNLRYSLVLLTRWPSLVVHRPNRSMRARK